MDEGRFGQVVARFHELTDKRGGWSLRRDCPGQCWAWRGPTRPSGYGRLRVGDIEWRPHRVGYLLHHGSLPSHGLLIHVCEHAWCTNPSHLRVGDQTDVVLAGTTRRRLSIATVAAVRELAASGLSQREIGRRLGVSRRQVSEITTRRRWPSVA